MGTLRFAHPTGYRLTTQEAVLSSRIDGTQATLDEVLEHEAGQPMPPEKQ